MVDVVTYDQTTFMPPPPARFEAGTPACVQAIGQVGEALRYMEAPRYG